MGIIVVLWVSRVYQICIYSLCKFMYSPGSCSWECINVLSVYKTIHPRKQ